MLARLSRGAARLLDVRLEPADGSSPSPEDVEAFSIDMNALGALLPSPELPWRRVAGLCRPVYDSLQNMISEDVEHVAKLLSEVGTLEDLREEEEEEAKSKDLNILAPHSYPQYVVNPRPAGRRCESLPSIPRYPRPCRRRRRSSVPLHHPLVIPSTHPSAPTIIITPCQDTSRSTTSWVPLQDASFGNKLTVPGYNSHNSSFPPQNLNSPCRAPNSPLIERWKWKDGHWWAILPDLDTQIQRGWHSRPISARKRTARPCQLENTGNVAVS